MFREMRRQKQELSRKECINILEKEPRGVLALSGDDGYPYAVPLSHVYVDGKIFFHGASEGHKIDAIRKNPKASFCVMDKGMKKEGSWWYTFRSVIVFGKITIINDRDEKIDRLTHLGNKFFPSEKDTEDEIERLLDRTEVFELTVEHMTGKLVREK